MLALQPRSAAARMAAMNSSRIVSSRTTVLGSRSNSSISAMAYKVLHRNKKQPPLPTIETPSWSTKAAISSILYETPERRPTPVKAHVLNCLVQNEPGVLSRVSGTLAARGFNIDSLVVCNTEVKDLSRMTIVLEGPDGIVEQARRQIEDLVPVWAVLDYTDAPIVSRELLLAKVSLLGPEYFEELLTHHGHAHKIAAGEASASTPPPTFAVKDFHPNNIPSSEALRHKHQHLDAISKLAGQFGGRVADISDRNCIVELCAKPERISAFIHLLQPFGILEIARSGMTALSRTPLDRALDNEPSKDADEIVDYSTLPPG
ncbi:acetolactate synthase regulatory subunit [Sugiyamaella lignohabitans]|uniref:Acetolactate synthase regulatory subunit n=1 Tax=Sugiyamaella lignohabitans TaxID=796027 RepID=A0A161HJ41_9ASCO|nr:acetolactate synthase regulatory subunit [Sugiyamaella lignohabitans]ANB11338.1 acetolactate synthase regulatory subunit [Sugiyamaella lignohabitans]